MSDTGEHRYSIGDLDHALEVIESMARNDEDPLRWATPVAILKREIERLSRMAVPDMVGPSGIAADPGEKWDIGDQVERQ